ncbi:DUF4173 domain-containing protein [Bacteroidota bacterium]
MITCFLGVIITSISVIVSYSSLAIAINLIVFFILIGVIIFPDIKSLLNVLGLSTGNIINSHTYFFKSLSETKFKNRKLGSYLWKFRIFIIPIAIIIIFLILYRFSNPVFDNLFVKAARFINQYLNFLFLHFDPNIILTFLLGMIISIFIFYRTADDHIIGHDKKALDILIRTRTNVKRKFRFNSLKNEVKAAVFLLIVLNIMILVLNIIDINWVWFNFEWNGQYLKQFVHEGTYLLIFTIVISIVIVLYFFRGNLNFYSKNQFLKYLSYFWLVQNGILTISVAIRNFWYIQYFSLAYKRIGVIIFLILTLYGLFSVLIKVKYKKSAFYLFKTNTYAILVILIISSLFNWDTIIAKYNFRNYERSFVHLDFLSTLSDKALPYLDKSMQELSTINQFQKESFPFKFKYMTPEKYHEIIEERKKHFMLKWESKTFLSWNLPEYNTYRKLSGRN